MPSMGRMVLLGIVDQSKFVELGYRIAIITCRAAQGRQLPYIFKAAYGNPAGSAKVEFVQRLE